MQTSKLPKQSSVKLCDPAHTTSKTVTHASSKQALRGQQLFALWIGSLGIFSPWISLCCGAVKLSTVPPGPRQLLGLCVCHLLFSCRWLVPGLSLCLLCLRLWRDEKLDLLCADGNFIWLKPSFEMFQGATKEQKNR